MQGRRREHTAQALANLQYIRFRRSPFYPAGHSLPSCLLNVSPTPAFWGVPVFYSLRLPHLANPRLCVLSHLAASRFPLSLAL